LKQNGGKKLGISQTMGMGQPLGQRERFIDALESLVRVAELPESQGLGGQATYPNIKPQIASAVIRVALRDRT
jgi:hypothetical protein